MFDIPGTLHVNMLPFIEVSILSFHIIQFALTSHHRFVNITLLDLQFYLLANMF